jgi:hypothetical protein
MKRGLVAILLSGSLIGLHAQSSISIVTVDRTSAPAFGQIVINGNGFLTTAAISVVFIARDAVTTTVPVAAVSPGSVRVAVPPLINSSNGNLFDTPVVADVQVVQVTGTSVMTSNVLGGLTIEPLPQAAGPTGTFTLALLRTLLDVQTDLRTARRSSPGFGDVVARSQAFTDAQASLLNAVELMLRSADAASNLPTPDNLPLSISARTLRAMDRVGSGFVLQANSIYRTAEPNPPARTTSCACNPISDLDRSLCEFRQNACSGYDPARRVNTDVAASLYGAQFSALGGWAAGGLSNVGAASETAGGIGLIAGQAFAYVASVMAGTEPPGSSSLRDAAMKMLEDLMNSGLAVFSGLKSATELTVSIESLVNQAKGPASTAPAGGLLTPASQPHNPPPSTRPAKVYTGATGVGPKWIATPITQQVTTVTTATLPAPLVARFNGTYSGTSDVTCTVSGADLPPLTQSASQPVSGVVVLNGSITGGGTISETGRFTAPAEGAAGITCQSGGFFWSVGLGPGDAGATGSISCTGGVAGATVNCSGAWILRRQ